MYMAQTMAFQTSGWQHKMIQSVPAGCSYKRSPVSTCVCGAMVTSVHRTGVECIKRTCTRTMRTYREEPLSFTCMCMYIVQYTCMLAVMAGQRLFKSRTNTIFREAHLMARCVYIIYLCLWQNSKINSTFRRC